jgi:hypothetical protein
MVPRPGRHRRAGGVKKLVSLRQHLLDAPGLKIKQDNLLVFAETGTVTCTLDPSDLSFRVSYRANVVITDFSGDALVAVFVVLQWLAENQPDANPDQAMEFDADIINRRTCDLAFTVDLREIIRHTVVEGGNELRYPGEPNAIVLEMPELPEGEPEA